MDHAFQKKLAPKDNDVTYQDPGSRHLLQNRQFRTEPVTQHHQMYIDYTVQQPSTSNPMIPQYAQTYCAEGFQQHFNNREVHQEDGAQPLLANQANAFGIRNKKCKSKRGFSADDDGKGGKKEFICKFCQKVFLLDKELKQHLATHSREKPYGCEDCGRRFSQKSALTRHMLTHTGEKPYVCTVCKRAFVQKYNLTLHSLIHSGEKKYICDVCNKCFSRKHYLYKHRYHQHSENTVFKQKRQNKNTEVSKTQEVRNTESQLEQQRICMKMQRQVPQHMVPQFLNLDAPGHPLIKTVAQQNIAHSVPHVLRQIGHQTEARNGHLSLAYFGQAIDTINHTLTPEVYQNFNIGAQSYNHLMTIDQQDIYDLGYKGMDRLGVGVTLESVIEQSTTAPHTTVVQQHIIYPIPSTMAAI